MDTNDGTMLIDMDTIFQEEGDDTPENRKQESLFWQVAARFGLTPESDTNND